MISQKFSDVVTTILGLAGALWNLIPNLATGHATVETWITSIGVAIFGYLTNHKSTSN